MSNDHVTQLGSIGLEVSDLPAWERFATDTLGLELAGTDGDGTKFLRMDENHHRVALKPGGRDDLAYAGWEVPDEAALRNVAERLTRLGVEVAWATAVQAQARRVSSLITLHDPDGVATEVHCGPLVLAGRSFRSPRAIHGFKAGRLGLGHIVLSVNDYDASLHFYRDGLGLRVTDYIDFDTGATGRSRVAFLHCGPRHHSIAIVQYAAPKRLHHFMLQLRDMDDVGTTYDLCRKGKVPIMSTLGCHTNDRMVSFYAQTPSGFQVEYGWGGLEVDDQNWKVQLHHEASIWGHHAPEVTAREPVAASS